MTTEIDLNGPGVGKHLARQILADIDAHAQVLYDDGPRRHLGASLIGQRCHRHLWYTFRWAKHKKFDGRLLRLFNRGHVEEPRVVEWLRGIGATVWTEDANGAQFKISGVGGHFGGSCDGVVSLPPRYSYSKPILWENKTNGTGAAFNNLLRDGLLLTKPIHYDQMCVYGFKLNLDHGLYTNTCKNDDNMHVEIVKLDHRRGAELEHKAEAIIMMQTAPARISEHAEFGECKVCDHHEICHKGKPFDKNCRSCTHCSPRPEKQWFCDKHNAIIPDEFIKAGCGDWSAIK